MDIINGLAYAVASNAAYVLETREFCLDEFIESYHYAGNNLEEARPLMLRIPAILQ